MVEISHLPPHSHPNMEKNKRKDKDYLVSVPLLVRDSLYKAAVMELRVSG